MVVRESGIYISNHGFIAASPDGIFSLVGEPKPCGVIEIKCLYSSRNVTVREACTTKTLPISQ